MSTTGVGIIGCGWVAQEHIKAFQNDERSQVRALVSRNRANAERYRDLHNLDCSIGADADEMLKQDDIDIVVVCTPHNTHTQYVVAAAQAQKHILIEKPVAITPRDLGAQLAAVRQSGVKTLVSFVLHWNPLLMTIDRLIEQGVFGNIFMVEVDYLHRIWMTTDDTTPFPDLEDAAKTHNVCFAADMSAEQGKAVMLADLES